MYRVCLILMFNLISAVPDINLIIRNKEEAICVGTGDEIEKFGLALVTPFLNDTIKYENFNSIDKKLTRDYKTEKIKSFEKNIPPVFDKRWKYSSTGSANKKIISFNNTNISVFHFSVRFKDTLTVALYFEDISYCDFIYETENISQTFTKNCPSIIKQTEIQDFHQWKHYTIFQKNNVFIIQPSHFSIEEVQVFSPSKFELISTNSMQYRFKKYDVLKIKEGGALAVFNNIKIFNHNCISIFLFIQSNCEIKFSLEDLDGEEINNQTFSTNETYTWKEIKMFFNQGINSSDVALLIDNSKKCNAVLDQNIYKCSDKYFEKVTINKEMQNDAQVACQQFQNNNLVIYSQPNTNVVTSSVDSFGLYTNITCNNIFNTEHCDKSLICSQNECYCSPGFKGNYCQEECPDGSWGSSCKNVCTNCMKNNCNKYSGICSKCEAGFYGDTCADTMFNLTLITILASNINIKIEAANYSTTSNITVQYKRISTTEFQYATCGGNILCNITHLQPLTEYKICVFYQNECFKKINFTTKCVGLIATNFKIIPEKKYCTIEVNKVTPENCPLKNYTLNINDTSIELKQTQVIESLTSFTDYSFKIKFMEDNEYLLNRHYNEIILDVKTKASEPGKVGNLKYDETLKKIKFETPIHPNGNIKNYELNITLTTYLSRVCNEKNFLLANYSTQNLYFPIENLNLFYRTVIFDVIAINEAGRGIPARTEVTFKKFDGITEEEKLIRISVKDNTLNIKPPDCDKILGPLIFKFEYKCEDTTCINKRKVYQTLKMEDSGNKTKIPELTPYYNYNVTLINYCRDETSSCLAATGISTTFKTNPDAPPQVRNLESFTQYDTSIGIRFQEPFPPHGVLEYYNIIYCKENICSYINKTNKCSLWNKYEDYKCVIINGLQKNHDYNITVFGVNYNVSKFGEGTTIFVKTEEIASSPPLNANFKIFKNNTVQLRWEYPEKPNGIIRNFNVRTEIIETKSKEYTDNETSVYTFTHEKNISDIKINRFYELNINDLKDSTMYHMYINAESTIIGEENEKLVISTYPKKPKLENEPTVKCNITHCQLFMEEIKDLLNENKICIYKIDKGENLNFKELEAKNKCLFIDRINVENRNLNSETFFKTNNSSNKIISDEYYLGIVVFNDFGNKRSYVNKIIIVGRFVNTQALLHLLWLLILIPSIITIFILWKTNRLSKFCRKRKQEIPEYMELPTINKLDLNNIKMNFGNSIKVILKDDIISKLEEEFENITITRNFSCDIGNEAENKLKNRNNEIIPYDETLVKLKGIPGLEYINANYVKTPFGNKTIIATQCPQLNTFYDFWRMIWQENVSIIICLATSSEGKDNFFQYWPTNLEEMIMKGITIEHKNNEIYTGYVVKNFEIKINEELEKTVFKAASRNIKLFTFLSWPNDDIPINPLSYYYFLRHVEKCDKGSQPIVVHCSDGYGRTGTFIMTYNLIIKNDQESIDISELLSSLRTCRPNLITQANQYRFVYYITDEFINGINKTLNLTQLFIKVNKLNDTELESDLNYVNNRLYINKLLYSYKINNLISPDDCTNVVYVNGYEKENHFMSAQHPTISTIESFWTMVFTKEIQLVISLHEMKNENNLWAFDTEMITFDSLEMELINKDDKTSFIVYDIKLIDPRNKNSTTCKLIKFKDWKFNQIAPRNYQAFRELYNLYINEASALMDNSPVLLTCVDGYTGCGLFIAVDLVLKKIKYTKEFNINWAVQSIQISREEFMTKKEQFKFIYEFSLYYNNLESRENLCINPTYLVPLKKL